MFDKIGLSYEQIDKILSISLAPDKVVDADALRDVITTAIVKKQRKIIRGY